MTSDLPPIVGTLNVVLADCFVAPPAPPHTYLDAARQLLNGMRVLATAQECAVPHALLAAQVAECSLKVYLSRNGDDTRLKSDRSLRHSLVKLWDAAKSGGLAIPLQPPDWLRRLEQLHGSPYYLRYSEGVHGLVLPPAEPMTAELGGLFDLIRRTVLEPTTPT